MSTPEQRTSKGPMIAVAVVVALLVGGGLGYLISDDSSSGDQTTVAAAPPTATTAQPSRAQVALLDVQTAIATQQLSDALSDYGAAASAIVTKEQAREAQARLRHQEAQIAAAGVALGKVERAARAAVKDAADAQARRAATVRARRAAALADQVVAAQKAAAARSAAAATGKAAAIRALRRYGRQLSTTSATLGTLLQQLSDARDTVQAATLLVAIEQEIARIERHSGGDVPVPDPDPGTEPEPAPAPATPSDDRADTTG